MNVIYLVKINQLIKTIFVIKKSKINTFRVKIIYFLFININTITKDVYKIVYYEI